MRRLLPPSSAGRTDRLVRCVILGCLIPAAILCPQVPVAAETVSLGNLFTEQVDDLGSDPEDFAQLGSWVLFAARTGRYGIELWRTDGTADGTTLVRDIRPGAASSIPYGLTTFENLVYFTASSPDFGSELWRTDGTPDGTVRVTDIVAGPQGSGPRDYTVVGDTLFFSAFDVEHGRELWKVTAGTVSLVQDIQPGPIGSTPANLLAMDSLLAFSATTAAEGRELVISDGSADGTKLYDLNRGANSNPRPLGAFEDRLLYLQALTSSHGTELWSFLPSTGKLTRLTDGNPGPASSNPRVPLMRGRDLAFVMDSDSGTAIYESISGGPASWIAAGFGSVTQLIDSGDEILYVSDGELWVTDNSPDGTRPLPARDILSAGLSDPVYLFKHQGQVYFFNDEGLWRSDGTADGTELFHACECEPEWIQEVGDPVYFSLDDQETGREVWRLQGTLEQVADLERDVGNSKPAEFTEAGGRLYFSAVGDGVGREIFGWDGEASTATLIDDLNAGSFSSFPVRLTTVGDSLYFRGFGGVARLYRIDDPVEGSVEVDGHFGDPVGLFGGELYTRQLADSSRQLFRVTGLTATQLSAFAPPSDIGVDLRPGAAFGDFFYFGATVDHANLGTELWRTDGLSVELAEDVLPGPAASSPSALYPFDGRLFFEANSASSASRSVWTIDGTAAGAEELAEVYVQSFFTLGDQLFFLGFEDVHGQEIWTSDGTPDGTAVFVDLVAGSENGVPLTAPVAVTESRFFFQAYQPGSGRELWVSDGTVDGTRLVRDIVPGMLSSQPMQITALPGDEVVFTAWSADLGWELWRSDGTALGTHRVADLFAGAESSEPTELMVYGEWVVFSADSGGEGREAWAYRWTEQPILFTDGFESGNISAWSSGR